MQKIINLILVASILVLIVSQPNEEKPDDEPAKQTKYRNQAEQIQLKERKRKDQIRLQKSTYKTFNFKLQEYADFIIEATSDQEIKGTIGVYWNQKNVYLMALVQKKQEIQLSILQDDRGVMFKDIFYTSTGFSFKAKAGKKYKILLQEKGQIVKLIMMHISQTILPSQKTTAKKDQMTKIEEKLQSAYSKLVNSLKQSEIGMLLSNKLNDEVYRKTRYYFNFQILQCLLVILGAWLQMTMITRLLKTSSII